MNQPLKMTFGQCVESLKQILVFFAPDKDAEFIYCETVYFGCKDIPADRFDIVCRELTVVMVPFKRPVTSEYREVYNRLVKERWEGAAQKAVEVSAWKRKLELEEKHKRETDAADKIIAGLTPEQRVAWEQEATESYKTQKLPAFTESFYIQVQLRLMAMRLIAAKKEKKR